MVGNVIPIDRVRREARERWDAHRDEVRGVATDSFRDRPITDREAAWLEGFCLGALLICVVVCCWTLAWGGQ